MANMTAFPSFYKAMNVPDGLASAAAPDSTWRQWQRKHRPFQGQFGGRDSVSWDYFNAEDPSTAWSTFIPQGFSPNQDAVLSGLYGRARSDYDRQYNRRVASGEDIGNFTWLDYLEAYDPFNDYNRLTPGQKGLSTARFAPQGRYYF